MRPKLVCPGVGRRCLAQSLSSWPPGGSDPSAWPEGRGTLRRELGLGDEAGTETGMGDPRGGPEVGWRWVRSSEATAGPLSWAGLTQPGFRHAVT